MKILHYSLGLPPYRSGGLTYYAKDLISEQIKQGCEVSLLYPGGITISGKSRIRKKQDENDVKVFEIVNPLPVPLYHGISEPSMFMPTKHDKQIYKGLLQAVQPQIIHIHTLMGLSNSLLELARSKHIKIVLTTHDFFGLCMKCTFINIINGLCQKPSPNACAWCNQNAKSLAYLRFRNQPIVIKLKNKLHKSYRDGNVGIDNIIDIGQFKSNEREYARLIEYYKSLYSYINKFHFNSTVTESVYKKFLGNINGKIVPITNASIKDNRNKGFYLGKTLKMVFVGHTDAFKGFPLLKSVLIELQQYDWLLDVWGGNEGVDSEINKIKYRGKYTKEDLPRIYANCTIAMIPSQWYETFSFVTLEALSYGVPVLVSENVGAKSIVAEYDVSFIFKSRVELKNILEGLMLDRSKVIEFHNKILQKPWHHDMAMHAKDILHSIYDK